METGTDIGIGVEGVKPGHKPGQQIMTGEFFRPQLLAGGEQGKDQKAGAVGENSEFHHFDAGLRFPQGGVDIGTDEEYEPEQVGDHEQLLEGDQVVHRVVHGVIVIPGNQLLGGIESDAKEGPE